jgi:hypothetical protein
MRATAPTRRLAGLYSVLLLIGCSGGAPPLPPDTMSVNSTRHSTAADFAPSDMALTCEQIARERSRNYDLIEADMRSAQSVSSSNETAALIGGYIAPAYLLIKDTKPTSEQVQQLYGRNDTLVKLANFKHCKQ